MAIRTKLAIWYSILIATILVLLAMIRYTGQRQILLDQKDYSLRVTAGILDAYIPRKEPSKTTIELAVDRMVTDYPDIEFKGTIIEVYDGSGSIIYSSSITEEQQLPIKEELWSEALHEKIALSTVSLGKDRSPVRILIKPVDENGQIVYLIQLGSSMLNIRTSLEDTLFLNMIFIPAAALLAGLGGWWLTRKGLMPLNVVIRTAQRISSGDLSHRIESTHAGQEIRDLAHSFNQMIDRLESSFQQIRDFSDNVSHELRIPLSILRGETELSLRRNRSEEEYRKVLESSLEEIHRMEKIVDKLLFLSRAERGEIKPEHSDIDLSLLLKKVHAQFKNPASDKNMEIILNIKGPAVIRGDEILVREMLANLIQNAITHTPPGGRVTLSLEEDEKEVKISVADTGSGIPAGDILCIFDRFYQVDKSRSSQGSGLGLSITKWIVEAHRGSITVDSIMGQGSRFTVIFPPITVTFLQKA
jgi:two-component system, OmpR family, sensor kinase